MIQQPRAYPFGISIVLPAYNEEDNIATAITRCLAVLEQLGRPHEVLVVNDGSKDQTLARSRELAERHPQVRVIDFERNRGYGVALSAGFQSAKYNLVFYTDSDNQFDVSELKYLLPIIDSYDLVVGFRIYRYDLPLRLFLSWGYNLLIRLLFRIRLHDVDCSFKLLRREIFDVIQLEARDFFIDTEIILKANRLGYRINEVGVRHYPRMAGHTTVRPSDIPRTLRTLMRIWRSARRLKPVTKYRPSEIPALPEIVPELSQGVSK